MNKYHMEPMSMEHKAKKNHVNIGGTNTIYSSK